MKIARSCLLAGLLSAAAWMNAPAPVGADPIGGIISYQGKLTGPDRTPLPDGQYNITFTFYESGNNTGITQTMPVRTFGGVFSTFLSVGALTFNVANSYDLGVSFNGVETRFPITSVPVAQVAKSALIANTVADGSITTQKLAPGAVSDVQLHDGAVTVSKIAASAVSGDKIADGTLTDAKISAVGAAKVTGQMVQPGPSASFNSTGQPT